VFYASQTILLEIPEHLLHMKRIATNSKLETSSILQVPNLDLLYQENGWGQSAFDMKPESKRMHRKLGASRV
jgi:chaperone required for assembly of F1-ATPase